MKIFTHITSEESKESTSGIGQNQNNVFANIFTIVLKT